MTTMQVALVLDMIRQACRNGYLIMGDIIERSLLMVKDQ